MDVILKISDLNKRFGGVNATDNISMEMQKNHLHALIGPNGAGKTTLISQISGILPSDSGDIEFNGESIVKLSAPQRALRGLARSFQVTSILPDFTCQENVLLAIQAHHGHSFKFWKSAKDEILLAQADSVLDSVGLLERSKIVSGQLAHGEKRRLEIAVALAMEPKLLVLDEPLAGMGSTDSEQMVQFLLKLKDRFSILLVEHDMDAVFTLSDRISVLVYGRLIATGTPKEVRNDTFVRQAYLGEDE